MPWSCKIALQFVTQAAVCYRPTSSSAFIAAQHSLRVHSNHFCELYTTHSSNAGAEPRIRLGHAAAARRGRASLPAVHGERPGTWCEDGALCAPAEALSSARCLAAAGHPHGHCRPPGSPFAAPAPLMLRRCHRCVPTRKCITPAAAVSIVQQRCVARPGVCVRSQQCMRACLHAHRPAATPAVLSQPQHAPMLAGRGRRRRAEQHCQ